MQPHTSKSKQGTNKKADAKAPDTRANAPKPVPAVPKKFDAVPLPEHGSHAHSYAAHLGKPMRVQTPPATSFRQVPLREPPQQISRIGKQHRG